MTTAEKLLPRDTRTALQSLPVKDCSRSLYFDRFSRPDLAKDDRNHFFMGGLGAHRSSIRAENWASFMRLDAGQLLFAQLQSRLMVNMAGGAMENAGLCLDRFGLPGIPGSAVKGCARRAAVAALHEWCETGLKPAGDDNLFTQSCAPFNSPDEMLDAVARVFGWSEQDWSERTKDNRLVSDFAWACCNKYKEIWKKTAERLASQWHIAIRDEQKETPWKSLQNFAGSVSFLPANPVDMGKTGRVDGLQVEIPLFGKLELDIVTCHHGKYYAGEIPVATDTEEPVPVIFPAVAAGHVFAFAVLPLRNCPTGLLGHARMWLATGLATFGIGAKTAAGYGWFDVSNDTKKAIANSIEKSREERELVAAKEKQDAAEKAKQAAEVRRQKELADRLAQLAPDQQEDVKFESLTDDQFRSALDNYATKLGVEQKAIVRVMRLESNVPGSRRSFWENLKAKAQKKGGKYAQTEQAVRQLSKQMFPGKEGKMP